MCSQDGHVGLLPPQIWQVLSLKWLAYFEHVFQPLLNTRLFEPVLDGHLITYHSIIGEQLRQVTKLGMSILVWCGHDQLVGSSRLLRLMG